MNYAGFCGSLGAGLIDHLLIYGIIGALLSLIGIAVFSCQEGFNCIHAVGARENSGWFNNVNINMNLS